MPFVAFDLMGCGVQRAVLDSILRVRYLLRKPSSPVLLTPLSSIVLHRRPPFYRHLSIHSSRPPLFRTNTLSFTFPDDLWLHLDFNAGALPARLSLPAQLPQQLRTLAPRWKVEEASPLTRVTWTTQMRSVKEARCLS
jgi:hypothetical protein